MVEEVQADEDAAEGEERLVDVVVALVADRQPAVRGEPGQRPLDHPAVTAELRARLDALAGDAAADAASAEILSAAGNIVRLVGVQLGRALARAPGLARRAPQGRDRRDQRLEEPGLVDVGRRERGRERDPAPVDHQMALRARFAAIRRIRPGLWAPLFAGTLAASR